VDNTKSRRWKICACDEMWMVVDEDDDGDDGNHVSRHWQFDAVRKVSESDNMDA
jgi:hypothetical protein